jgi:hypothetical protein
MNLSQELIVTIIAPLTQKHGEGEGIRKRYPFPVIIEYVNSSNILKWIIIMSDSMHYHNIQTNILYNNSGSMTKPYIDVRHTLSVN